MVDPNARDNTMGRGMLWMAAIGGLVILTLFFQSVMPEKGGIQSSSSENGRSMVVLKQDRSGHFLALGAINGQTIEFLVDTGATDVAVSERKARAMGLKFGPEVVVMTAAGPVKAWMTRLDSVSLGDLRLSNVRATITPGLGENALLGMSFLKNFSIRTEGDTLVIASGGQGT